MMQCIFTLLRVDQSMLIWTIQSMFLVQVSFSHVLVQPVSVHFVGGPAHAHKIMFGK